MKFKWAFVVWGVVGFIYNFFILLNNFLNAPPGEVVGVGTSSWASSLTLMWIGGLLFFGLGTIISNTEDLRDYAHLRDGGTDVIVTE